MPAEPFSQDIAGHSVVHHWNRCSRYTLSRLSSRGSQEPWPSSTSVCCWHCTEPFECQPIGIPSDILTDTGQIVCDGNFCSYSCALTWLFSSGSTHREYQAKQLLTQVAREQHGVSKIVPAPPMLALAKFGGPMSIEQFRSTQTTHAIVVSPPFVCQGIVYEERFGGDEAPSEEEDAEAPEACEGAEGDCVRSGGGWGIQGLRAPEQSLPPEEVLCDSEPFGDAMFDKYVEERRSGEAAEGADDDYGGQLGKFMRPVRGGRKR